MFPLISALLLLSSLSISDQIFSSGIWVYLLVFLVITFSSTIVGGMIPDNMLLLLAGAAAVDNGLSVEWLLVMAVGGGFAGYEINYWSGRLLGRTICQKSCPMILNDKNVQKAQDLMDKFGPVSLILSRFLPVLNLPSFIAGIKSMDSHRYVVYNLFSAMLWCGILLAMGYYIGKISLIGVYLDYITDFFIIITAVIIIIVGVMFVRDYINSR